MKNLGLFPIIGLLIILCFSMASAQVLEPAKWSFESEQISEDTLLLHFDVKLDDGWYVYGQFISDEGPVPTSFTFSENKHVQLAGTAIENGEIEKEGFDEIFGIDLKKFGKSARFSQKVVVGKKAKKISGELEYMTCDATRCLPPQLVEFEFDLSKSKSEESEEGNERGFLEPVKWNIEFNKTGDPELYELIFRAEIDENWYLYSQFIEEGGPVPTSFNFDSAAHFSLIGNATEKSPKSKKGFDEIFQMELLKFGKSAEFSQKIKVNNTDEKISGELEFMTCDDTRCLPPQSIAFEAIPAKGYVALGDDIDAQIDAALLSDGSILHIEGLDLENPVANCGIEGEVNPEDQDKKKGLLNLFFLGFLGGLVALLTPCVFPMIPLTVSFFTKGSQGKKKGIANASIYGFFIFAIYLILSLPFHFLDSINPDILNEISTNVYLNIGFFVIFIFFAGSFFGYYELTLPSALTNKMDSASDVGGIIGIFFMAVTLALVSFSCTGPILGSLLAGALSSDGGAIQLSAGMGGFGLALALPFALFAAFPGWLNTLPKSGGWLNSVKVVLGFLELGLAIKFLSNADLVSHWGILKREIFFGIWIVIGVLMALYLFGKLKFPHDSPIKKLGVGRIALGAITVAFVLYLIPGLTNTKYANLKLLSGFPPPMFYSLYEQESQCPLNLSCYKDYEKGMAAARAENKPVMIDFTGWACVNCRRMEENVWVDPIVYKILSEEFVLISLYVDDRTELAEEEQIYVQQNNKQRQLKTIGNKWSYFQTNNFNNNSQPYYALISPDEKLLNTPVGYMPEASEYAAFLNCGLNAFKNLEKMKGFFLVKNGAADKAFELRDLELGKPDSDQVLVKTEAFGLNYADVMARLGLYRDCPPLPCIVGYEAVGRIESVGADVKDLKVGDRVLAFTRFGAYASHIMAKHIAVVPIGEEMTAGVATALATQYSTAWYALEECLNLHKGDRILIHAAAGGVGTALIQMAKRRGCIIAGTASAQKHDYLKEQGVDLAIDYRNQDFEKVLTNEGWGGKLDAIFDPVGGISVRKGANLLNSGGSMVLYGGSSMSDSNSPLHKLKVAAGFGIWSPIVLLMRSISLIGVNMLRIADDKPELLHHCMMQVVELANKGELKPTVGGEFKASELAKAHDFLESRKSIGKIVVHWDQ